MKITLAGLTLLSLAWLSTDCAAEAAHPNVLLVMTDDQGYGDFSFTGNPHLKTPHIDGLARSGISFERFFVNAFCSPTRAALLTGRYPLRCGVWGVTHNKEAMRSDEVTLAEALRGAGYRTGCFGKWHNGEQFPFTPTGQGFDEFLGFHNGHINNYFDTELLRGSKPQPTKGYITDVLTDEAIRFIRESTVTKKPFFSYVAFNAPHSPFQVPDQYFDRFKAQELADDVAAFYGMCENIDDNVGRLLAALDELKLANDTIVVFLTDNGGTAGVKINNAGMRGGKTSPHEGGSRVPLLIRWPSRFSQPRVVTKIASHIDLYPTLLGLCGVTPPPGPKLDGIDLRPLLEGDEKNWPERTLYLHQPASETNRYPGAVRTERYRLVREAKGAGAGSKAKANDAGATSWQLYDMAADPGQTKDLAKEMPELVERLSRQYEAWYDDISSNGLRRFPLPVGHAEENPVTLHAPQAFYDGSLKFQAGPGFAHDWLTNWTDAQSTIRYELDVARAGLYDVTLLCARPRSDKPARLRVRVGEQVIEAEIATIEAKPLRLPHRDEDGHAKYQSCIWPRVAAGRLKLAVGTATLKIESADSTTSPLLDFKGIELTRVEEPSAIKPNR